MISIYRKFGSPLSEITFPIRKDGKVDVCPVDAFAGQTFNMNEFGHIKSDVSAFMEAQTKGEQDLIAQRLVEAQGENPDLSGLTDSDIFKYSMSRYYQTPAEVESFGEALGRAQFERSERLAKEASDKAALDAEKKAYKQRQKNIAKAIADGKLNADGTLVEPKS